MIQDESRRQENTNAENRIREKEGYFRKTGKWMEVTVMCKVKAVGGRRGRLIFYQFRVEREQELQRGENIWMLEKMILVKSMKLSGGRNMRFWVTTQKEKKLKISN